jgi:hypothetical protein
MNDTYIWIMIITTVVGLVAFVVLHKEEGVKQRIRIYGEYYTIITTVYVNGKRIDRWEDSSKDDDEYQKIREDRLKEAKEFYNNLTANKDEV